MVMRGDVVRGMKEEVTSSLTVEHSLLVVRCRATKEGSLEIGFLKLAICFSPIRIPHATPI